MAASDPMLPDFSGGSASDTLRSLLGYITQRGQTADNSSANVLNGVGPAATYDQARGLFGQGLSPQAMSAFRTNATSGINDQYQGAAQALNSQLLRRGAAGQQNLPGSGGDISRAYQPLYSAMEAAKTKANIDQILANENQMNTNNQLALSATNNQLSAATGMFNAGTSAIAPASSIANNLADLEPASYKNLLLTTLLSGLLGGKNGLTSGGGTNGTGQYGVVGDALGGLKDILTGGGNNELLPTPATTLDNPLQGYPDVQAILNQITGGGAAAPGAVDITSPNGIIPGVSTDLSSILAGLPQTAAPPAMSPPPVGTAEVSSPDINFTDVAGLGSAAVPAISGALGSAPGLASAIAMPAELGASLGLPAAGAAAGIVPGAALPAFENVLPIAAPEVLGPPAAEAGAATTGGGGLGSAAVSVLTNPITIFGGEIALGAYEFAKAAPHNVANVWVDKVQNKFDTSMRELMGNVQSLAQSGQLTPEDYAAIRQRAQENIANYQQAMATWNGAVTQPGGNIANTKTAFGTVIRQAQSTFDKYYGPGGAGFLEGLDRESGVA